MYTFNSASAMECSRNIAAKKAMVIDLENRLIGLKTRLEALSDSDAVRFMINRTQKSISEQKEKLSRMEYVIVSAADVYRDSDKKGLEICGGDDTQTFVKNMTMVNNDNSGAAELPVSVEIK